MLGVPLLPERVDTFTTDRLVAGSAPGGKGSVETVLTVRPALLLEEGTTFEGPKALCADEVVDMPLLVKSRHTAVQDRLVTVCAASTEQLLVALFAMRLPVLLVKVAGTEGVLAVAAHEVLGVVGISEGLDHLSQDGVTAVSAGAA